MTTALLLIAVATCVLLLLSGLGRKGGIYEFPFLAGATFAGFALPQLVGLANDPFLPPGGLDKTLLMLTLAAGMCWLGRAAAAAPMRIFAWSLDGHRLLCVAAILSLVGGYFYFAISRLPAELTETSQWTGLPVAYLFFARMLTYGFAIAVLLFLRNGSKVALLIVLFDSLFYLDRILLGGRRADTAEFFLICLFAGWFARGWALPRLGMLLCLLFGTLFINSIGDYRSTVGDKGLDMSAIFDINVVANLEKLTKDGGAELTNAVYVIAAVDKNAQFDFGAFHWNTLIFNYVPAQIVGENLKSGLMLPTNAIAFEEFSHTAAGGSTFTGLSDSFRSFWYLGCVEFFLIAFIMAKIYHAAQAGSVVAQLFYMLIITPALHSITHHTAAFVTPWPHIFVFMLPALWLARARISQAESTSDAPGCPPTAGPDPIRTGANLNARG